MVTIKDFIMPTTCAECPLYTDTGEQTYNFHCALLNGDYIFKGYEIERHDECRLEEKG